MDSPPHIPYQAYKSKRHTRTVSSAPSLEPNVSPPPKSRPTSYLSSQSPASTSPVNGSAKRHSDYFVTAHEAAERIELDAPDGARQQVRPVSLTAFPSQNNSQDPDDNDYSTASMRNGAIPGSKQVTGASMPDSPSPIKVNGSTADAGPSIMPDNVHRRSSTFRHVPLRVQSISTPRTPSPLRLGSTHTRTLSAASPSPVRQLDQLQVHSEPRYQPSSSLSVVRGSPSPLSRAMSLQSSSSTNPSLDLTSTTSSSVSSQRNTPTTTTPPEPFIPPQRTSSLLQQPSAPPPSQSSSTLRPSTPSTPARSPTPSTPSTHKAVYRPGFQPKGVYRPLTDDFLALRQKARAVGRVERTRLERRFEKLIELHFSPADAQSTGSGEKDRPPLHARRRTSSLFDFDLNELRTKGASELWRSVLESRVAAGGKGDIRAAEQKITPWQDDADVTACPLCSAAFHPLTNRKHHCRLCGQIICSLPPKQPQRPVPCSLLFVADPKTRRIEEVSEVVDYGVRPRSIGGPAGLDKPNGAEEKFLKGVRICRECKPIMLQQNMQEAKRVPTFARLYEALTSLESEIEDALPQFQELMLSLSNHPDDAPTKEATAARKRLLESFAEYDALSKRIRKLPCPGGPGSSQDRVQMAILTRANLFLQKNMFPLQSLPKPQRRSASAAGQTNGTDVPVIDPDSQLAHALQPLLEQEALLESFIEEAKAHRKFEDAKTLKANLGEIRAEIDRVVAIADGGNALDRRGKDKKMPS